MKKQSKLTSYFQILVLSLFLSALILSTPHLHSDYLLNKVGSNTVFITNPKGALIQGSATGFEVIAPSGKIYTLTNAHVCELGKDQIVLIQEKRHSDRLIPRHIIEVYSENDLCLIEGLPGYEGLSLADSVDIGDLNYAIGYPLGQAMNLSSGFIKNFEKVEIALPEVTTDNCVEPGMRIKELNTLFGPVPVCMIQRRSIHTNIPIYPGNSGSPMVNAFGHVTGVIFASNNQTTWGFAVPLDDVVDFLKAY